MSLGIFNRLWTLLENQCKQLDFTLVTESTPSTNSFPGVSADTINKWSNLQSELDTVIKYAGVVSVLLAYTSVSVEDLSECDFHKSLVEELEAAERRTKDLVHKIHLNT